MWSSASSASSPARIWHPDGNTSTTATRMPVGKASPTPDPCAGARSCRFSVRAACAAPDHLIRSRSHVAPVPRVPVLHPDPVRQEAAARGDEVLAGNHDTGARVAARGQGAAAAGVRQAGTREQARAGAAGRPGPRGAAPGVGGAAPPRRGARVPGAAPARGPAGGFPARAARRVLRRRHRRRRARRPPRLPQGARPAPVARAGDAGQRGGAGLGARRVRPRRDPADRRGPGRAAVPRHASPPRLARGRRQAAGAGRQRRSHGDRAGRSRAVKILGIDLGTTNSALATAQADDEVAARAQPIAQVIGPGEVAERATLPSFLLLPSELEVAAAQLQLPWSGPLRYAVGEFARERGAELPHRLVASAKSWLCNPAIDRTAQVLPFRGAQRELDAEMAGGERVSPVNASARYLAHLRAAWDDANPDEPAGEQEVLVTVPASFDPVARELTVVAAREAGFDKITLLEEPQAAFY